jgi:branched-chain amino acid transport system permease protein
MQVLLQSLLNGILLGGLYAAIGLGMSLIFGIMGLINLAHGDLIIVSTYMSMVIAIQFSGNIFTALLITVLVMIVVGFFCQSVLINRVVDKGAEPPLLITFGLSVILENVLQQIFGADAKSIPTKLAVENVITTPWFSISAIYLIDFVVSILVILSLHFIIMKTYFGRAIRATSGDVVASELVGLNTKRIYAMTMALAMVTASIAGLLVGMTFTYYPTTGTEYLIIAFGVVVIGGMGSLVGTLLGGIILGLAQILGSYFFGMAYQLFFGYVVLLVILTFRPQGLFANTK